MYLQCEYVSAKRGSTRDGSPFFARVTIQSATRRNSLALGTVVRIRSWWIREVTILLKQQQATESDVSREEARHRTVASPIGARWYGLTCGSLFWSVGQHKEDTTQKLSAPPAIAHLCFMCGKRSSSSALPTYYVAGVKSNSSGAAKLMCRAPAIRRSETP